MRQKEKMVAELGSWQEDRPLGRSPGPSWSGPAHAGQALCCRACDSNSGCSLAGLRPGQQARLLPQLYR